MVKRQIHLKPLKDRPERESFKLEKIKVAQTYEERKEKIFGRERQFRDSLWQKIEHEYIT